MQSMFVEVGLRATGASRRESFLGRQFRVIPSVLVRSQVLRNNLGVCFLPAADITDEWAALWNGVPVLVGDHPKLRGEPCSGRDSSLWNERLGGWIFHAVAQQETDNIRQLRGEVWLDESRAGAVAGLQAILNHLEAGRTVELSTGFPAELTQQSGMDHGSMYEQVMHPVGADHLVISTEMKGACSVIDGCGLGINKFEGTPPMENEKEVLDLQNAAPKPTSGESRATFMTRCLADPAMAGGSQSARFSACTKAYTKAAGNGVPVQAVDGADYLADDFAYVPDPQAAGTWKLPIFDSEHTKTALAKFTQTQVAVSEQTKTWRKILAAADKFNIPVSDRTTPAAQSATGIKAALARVADLFLPSRKEPLSWEENAAQNVARDLEIRNSLPSSDQDRQTKLRVDLQEKFGSKGDVILADVYSETTEVVFWLMTPLGSSPQGSEYYRVTFTEGADGGFTFTEPVMVQKKTVYEPVGNTASANNSTAQAERGCGCLQSASQEEATMPDKKEGQGAEGAGLAEQIAALATAVQSLTGKVDAIQKASEQDPNPAIAGLKRTVGELIQKFDGMKSVTETAVQERARERESLVTALAGNYKVPFNQAELESKPLEELRKLAVMAQVEDYSGKGGPRGGERPSNEARFVAPVSYWDKEKQGQHGAGNGEGGK